MPGTRLLNHGGRPADDEIEIRTLVSFHGKSSAQYILDITPLNEARTALAAGRVAQNVLADPFVIAAAALRTFCDAALLTLHFIDHLC